MLLTKYTYLCINLSGDVNTAGRPLGGQDKNLCGGAGGAGARSGPVSIIKVSNGRGMLTNCPTTDHSQVTHQTIRVEKIILLSP
jgi:hypothetical protein